MAIDAVASRRRVLPGPVPLVLGSMTSVQVGAALSVGLSHKLGSAGLTWVRLIWATGALLWLVRPSLRLREIPSQTRWASLALGVTTGVMTLAFFAAIVRLPLGEVSALEFLGPLGVAIAARHSGRSGLVLPLLAAAGVACLTHPWTGSANVAGVLYALLAAAGWAGYILLTRRVGDALPGLTGLALSLAVATVIATPFGLPQATGHLTLLAVAEAAGLAVLVPLLPYALELVALRRLRTAAFGTLMSLEPGIGMLSGLVLLGQRPRLLGVAGICLVVAAGIGAHRTGQRQPPRPD
jgi:inner membrane transporter RhtA